MIITVRKRSLGQGNVFTPVYHSVHQGGRWVGFPTCITGHMTRGSASQGGSASRGLGGLHQGELQHPGGLHPVGLGRPPSPGKITWDTTGYSQQAGSTHLTGMLSC